MLSAVLGVMAVFLFLLVIWMISYYSMKRKRKAYIHEMTAPVWMMLHGMTCP